MFFCFVRGKAKDHEVLRGPRSQSRAAALLLGGVVATSLVPGMPFSIWYIHVPRPLTPSAHGAKAVMLTRCYFARPGYLHGSPGCADMSDALPGQRIPDGDNFRISSKNIALTYEGHLDKKDLYDFITNVYDQDMHCRIAHETSEGGYEHTHALVMFSRKQDVKNCRKFDFLTEDGQEVHPNIRKITTLDHLGAWRKYINKQDPNPYGDLPAAKASNEEKFEAATEYVIGCKRFKDVFKCPDISVAMVICQKITYFKMLWETNAKKPTTTTPHTVFTRPKLDLSLKNWLVCGKAGSGKTAFALSHGKEPVLLSHIDDGRKITDTTDLLVFDDMSFNNWPAGSIIHLLDREQDRSIHARYNNVEIPAGLPKIFTSNREDIFVPQTVTPEEQAGIDRRFKTLKINASLF